MNICVHGEHFGVTPGIDDADEDFMIDNPILRVEHNTIHPSGFIVSIEDGDEILDVRINVSGMKRILKHVIDEL